MIHLKWKHWARLGVIGMPLIGLGCSQVPTVQPTAPNAMQSLPESPVDPAMSLTSAYGNPAPAIRATSARTETKTVKAVPISLDAVLRLAEAQNPQIAVARSKVATAFSERNLAAVRWVPDVNIGVGYYRHEGGIQLQEGPLVNSSTQAFLGGLQLDAQYNPREYAFRQVEAARKVWTNQGELSKITYEQLLDASTTYVDYMAAHSALAVSQQLEKKIREVHDKATKAFNANQTVEFEIMKIRAEADLKIQAQTQQKLAGQIEAAAAKLAYALGLGDNAVLQPIDMQMAAFNLVDGAIPTDDLVAQAMSNGPGVRELEGILRVIQTGLDVATGPGRWVPMIKFQLNEGGFGAGVTNTLDWANRLDMGIQAKWNISDLALASRKRQVAVSQLNSVHQTYAELKARLTLGVQEARSTIMASGSQFGAAEELVKQGKTVVEKTQLLADNAMANVTYIDVLAAHKALAMAQLNYIDLLREFDKAQLRLLVLVGPCMKSVEKDVPLRDDTVEELPAPKILP